MDKDTALACVDKARDLISRLPEGALVVNVDLEHPGVPSRPVSVHIHGFEASCIEGDFEVVSKSFSEVSFRRYEHRFYPAKDIENAGYLHLVVIEEAAQ